MHNSIDNQVDLFPNVGWAIITKISHIPCIVNIPINFTVLTGAADNFMTLISVDYRSTTVKNICPMSGATKFTCTLSHGQLGYFQSSIAALWRRQWPRIHISKEWHFILISALIKSLCAHYSNMYLKKFLKINST